jgi:hypothetical protein
MMIARANGVDVAMFAASKVVELKTPDSGAEDIRGSQLNQN